MRPYRRKRRAPPRKKSPHRCATFAFARSALAPVLALLFFAGSARAFVRSFFILVCSLLVLFLLFLRPSPFSFLPSPSPFFSSPLSKTTKQMRARLHIASEPAYRAYRNLIGVYSASASSEVQFSALQLSPRVQPPSVVVLLPFASRLVASIEAASKVCSVQEGEMYFFIVVVN